MCSSDLFPSHDNPQTKNNKEMSALPDCWNSVIGFTRTDDTCIDDAYPVGYSESLSGLYIDELQGMTLRILDNTDNSTTLW